MNKPDREPEATARAKRGALNRAPRRARPKERRSDASSISRPEVPWSICSWIPPTRVDTTARSFHIASATVRPNPSARLFWTTTVAWRWIALTVAAFSSRGRIEATVKRSEKLDPAKARALWRKLLDRYGDTCLKPRIEERLR